MTHVTGASVNLLRDPPSSSVSMVIGIWKFLGTKDRDTQPNSWPCSCSDSSENEFNRSSSIVCLMMSWLVIVCYTCGSFSILPASSAGSDMDNNLRSCSWNTRSSINDSLRFSLFKEARPYKGAQTLEACPSRV
jgi:hypothetical protein